MSFVKKVPLSGWGNYPVSLCCTSHLRNSEEIKTLLRNESIISRGLGRSYGDQAINQNGLVAITTRLNSFLSWDEKQGILECQAGVSLEEILITFVPRGWMPMICPGTKFVTLGGAIANDIHGKAHHIDGSFCNCVLSFKILLASGEIVESSRSENSDLFWANFGGLGLLGIILTVKMKLRKIESTYYRQKSMAIKNLDHMLDAVNEYDQAYHYSVAWVDPLAKGKKIGSGVLSLGNAARLDELSPHLKQEPLKMHANTKLTLPVFLPSFALNSVTVRLLNRVIAFVQNSSKDFIHYEKFFFPLDAIHNWNKGYGKRGFIQYQFVLPEDGSRKRLYEILNLIANSGCKPFLNVFKKMGEGNGILSFPFKGYTLAIDFPVSEKLFSFTRKLDEKVLEAGGRIYLGKDALLEEEMFKKMYPQYIEWLAIKRKYDPESKFSSDLSRRLGLTAPLPSQTAGFMRTTPLTTF